MEKVNISIINTNMQMNQQFTTYLKFTESQIYNNKTFEVNRDPENPGHKSGPEN